MSRHEQENDLGGGGGEADDETLARAKDAAAERRAGDEPEAEEGDESPQPWAKALPGDDD